MSRKRWGCVLLGILRVLLTKHIRAMPILYVRTGCQYCAKVLQKGRELGVEFELRNVADDGVSEELIARGGKRQMPYFVDTLHGIEMYESDDIVAYLEEKFPLTT